MQILYSIDTKDGVSGNSIVSRWQKAAAKIRLADMNLAILETLLEGFVSAGCHVDLTRGWDILRNRTRIKGRTRSKHPMERHGSTNGIGLDVAVDD